MNRQNSILIIIPAYNEEKKIGKVLSDINKYVKDDNIEADILVINDGSEDSTEEIAREYGVDVISLPYNAGYGVALQTGFKYAIKNKYDYLIHMDADGQHEPKSIISLLREIQCGQVDIVIGSRYFEHPDYEHKILRKIGVGIFRAVVTFVIKQNITDPTSGFQALNRKAFEFYSYSYPTDFPDADVIITSYLAGLKIKEIPVKIHTKPFGKSMHDGIKPFYYVFKMLLSIFVTLLRKKPESICIEKTDRNSTIGESPYLKKEE